MPKKIYREFFHVSKHKKMTDKVFKTHITLSVFTMLICCVVFCTATFAWFTCQQTTSIAPIEAAKYAIAVEIDNNVIPENKYTCPLAAADEHTFTITAIGTATTGYCEITADGKAYITAPIAKGQSITLTVIAKQGTEISFSAHWGEYRGDEPRYEDGSSVEIQTAY